MRGSSLDRSANGPKAAEGAKFVRSPGPPLARLVLANDGREIRRSKVDSSARLVLAARRAPGDLGLMARLWVIVPMEPMAILSVQLRGHQRRRSRS
jgi:hypothetical protein